MRRVLIYDRFDAPVCELAQNDVFELLNHQEINGEHSLSITTTKVLSQGDRVLMEDDRGYWHEWVIYGTDSLHESGGRPYGTYYCVWSVQPDLMGTRISAMPGVQSACPASDAVTAVVSGTSRWTKGTVTNTNTGGASMYDTDGWTGMSTLLETWGGEVDVSITVGSTGVTARSVDLYSQQGDQTPKRRYDFGADLKSIRRTLEDGPLYCRITPRGKGEESGAGYGRKITIEDVNSGKDYLEYAPMVDLAKLPDGNGGWEYPTLEIENSDCETPASLKAWAQSVIEECLVPKITYEVDVLQAACEGIDLQGVSLGDAVHIVDRKFNLRLTGRVVMLERDEIADAATTLTIGYIGGGLADRFGGLDARVTRLTSTVQAINGGTLSTADYLDRLLDRLNTEINATGGYTYIVQGEGIKCYDTAVTDPLIGAEASAAVEIKGGTIRIANTKTAQGAWEWKTVFTSGHIAAAVVTAANLVAGYIGNVNGNYWNLDTGELIMKSASGITFDGTDLDEILIDNAHYEYYVSDSATSLSGGSWSTTTPTYTAGSYIWQRLVTVREDGTTTYSDAVALNDEPSAFVRSYSSGVLVCRVGQSTGALVNASGYFDVVKVTWSDGVPTAAATLARFSESQIWLGKNSSSSIIDLCNGAAQMKLATNGDWWTNQFTIQSNGSINMQWLADGSTYQAHGQQSFVRCYYRDSSYSNSRVEPEVFIRVTDDDPSGWSNWEHDAGLLVSGATYDGSTLKYPAQVVPTSYRVSLYRNASGTNGSITLNFALTSLVTNYVAIYYKGNDGYLNCTVAYPTSTGDLYADLNVVESTVNGSLNIKSRRIKISGKNLTNVSYAEMDNGNTPTSTNNVYIVKVEAFGDANQ